MENNVIIFNNIFVKKFFDKYWLSKNSILFFFKILDKWLIDYLKENISDRAFQNLFFRQFYFLIEKNKIDLFIISFNFLIRNKKQIIFLLANYHYELIFREYLDNKIIFRYEIYNILIQNIEYIKKLDLKYEKWIYILYTLNLISLNIWSCFKDISLNIQFFDNSIDASDSVNWITLSIYDWNIEFFSVSFYVWKGNLIISNIQLFSYDDIYIIKPHKILLYTLLKIWKRLGIEKVISFSNENHPCKYHTINNWFKWNYNNILKNIWMNFIQDNYLYWNLCNLEVKWLNMFIKENIDYNLENIFKFLKI